MPLYSTNVAGSGSGSGIDLSQAGNGIMVHHNGQITTVELQAVAPAFMHNGNGLGGNPRVGVEPWLARGLDLDLAVAGDHILIGNSYAFVTDRIVISMAHGIVGTAISGGIYTSWGKSGEKIYDLPNSEWQKLTSDVAIIDCKLPREHRETDYLYIWLDVANADPLKVNAYAYGDNLQPSDIRGRPI